MLNRLIEASIRHRLMVVALTLMAIVYGLFTIPRMDVDVLPDLNRPVVTIMTEAHGMAPEETEVLVSFPIETMMNGATGVQRVRSASSAGFSIVFVEFDWGTDIFRARQIVNEKLQLAQSRLPEGSVASLAPISSIMGEIMLVSLSSKSGKTPPIEVRSLADFVVRPRLLAIPGVSQVVPIGGGSKQYQVLTSPARLKQFGVTLDELVEAARKSNLNAGGGFFQEPQREAVIRIQGRVRNLEDIASTVIKSVEGVPVTIGQVADVEFAKGLPRGDASVNGEAAVILSVQKQPDANTLLLIRELDRAIAEIAPSLPEDVQLNQQLFRQEHFIKSAISNVVKALAEAGLIVLVVILAFLMNVRATIISLVSIPVSFILTLLMLNRFGININTMTLGGLAIAIGLVVDDSIVDVENVFRRLRLNALATPRRSPLRIIYSASAEIRNSIVFATLIIVLVFIPLLSLEGMEGRVFLPLGLAFIFSMSASLIVSLTLTPALCGLLLRRVGSGGNHGDSRFVAMLKRANAPVVFLALRRPWAVMASAAVMVAVAAALLPLLGREFLPKFNEGSLALTAILPPGTGLNESNRIGTIIEKTALTVPEVTNVGRRTGRAEMDEHAEGVNHSEIDIGLKDSRRGREAATNELRQKLAQIPGVYIAFGQPISHRLDHLSSGVRAALAVKVYGTDLAELRKLAAQVETTMSSVAGIVDLQVEPQVEVPQLSIEIDRQAAARYGVTPYDLAENLEVALAGHNVSQVLQGQRTFDLVVWFSPEARGDFDAIRSTLINTPAGPPIPLGQLATVRRETGPNTINRENVSRRIVVQANVEGRDLNSVVTELQDKMRPIQSTWPRGYYVEYGGQFQAQQSAMSRILLLGVFTVVAIFLVLNVALRSWRMALQVMVNLPLALVGGVIAAYASGGVLSIASLVGFITLFGIATRNGIMMLSHYVHLMREEGMPFGKDMILRGTQERLSPVLMTALAAALGLLPLALAKGEPGTELLQPIAVVILGGLVSSTLLDQIVTPALFWVFGRREWKDYVPGTHVDTGGFDELDEGDHRLEAEATI
ncbi:MAG: efflux RND transporter permease subunit [Methanoregulaceae archaeon]|nr:efflux RND transporter permease subunit [Methanoregulaceae archaeon]